MNGMLEVRHLRLVRAIAEEGGPTRAGARLHLTQSAVSHQLAELEGRLGVVLFQRVRRKLQITPAGERLLEAARDTLGELARVERDLHRSIKKRVPLRVTVECFTAYHWVPSIAAWLARAHPHVELRIVLGPAKEPVAALLRGEIDVAITSSPVRDRALVVTRLFDDEWTLVLAPDHPLAARSFVTMRDLVDVRLLTHDAPRTDVERLRELIAAERVTMPEVSIVPLTETIVGLSRARLGVGLVSRWAVAPYVDRGEVVVRRLTRKGLPETWSSVYRRDASDHLPLADISRRLSSP